MQSSNLNFFDHLVAVNCTSAPIQKKIFAAWGGFETKAVSKNPAVHIHINHSPLIKPIKCRQFFSDAEFLLATGDRYLLTCYLRHRPWQIHLSGMAGVNDDSLYYEGFEPALGSILRRLNVFRAHASAVMTDKGAIIFCGPSGCGKSTTAFAMVRAGCRYLADDTVLLSANEAGIRVHGRDKGFSFRADTFDLFPQFRQRGVSRGTAGKRHVLRNLGSQNEGRDRRGFPVAAVVFPRVGKQKVTKVRQLSSPEVMMHLLNQDPRDVCGILSDRVAIEGMFSFYGKIADQLPVYSVSLGHDTSQLVNALERLG